MKKIVIDALGGDNGMDTTVGGAIMALRNDKDLRLVLVGDKEVILPKVTEFGDRVEIVHTTENISCEEQPTAAIRKQPNSSLILGIEKMKTDAECGALISAGSTGAVLAGGFFKVGRIAGVSRPALCPSLPTKDGRGVTLIDCGANADCKPENLVHFALMANELKKSEGVENPRIALLSNGAEKGKGNEAVKATYPIFEKLHEAGLLNFVGNIEARDTVNGVCDVIVCDGFTGNVLLKTAEGTMKFAFSQIKAVLKSGFLSKIAALLIAPKLKKLKRTFGEDAVGGTMFIGLTKPVIKAHGNASALAFANAIKYAAKVINIDLEEKIKAAVGKAVPYLPVN
jgi:glycerol-3-phosphate acyltransferase PlsX